VRRSVAALCSVAFAVPLIPGLATGSPPPQSDKSRSADAPSTTDSLLMKYLPVRKVVLYKNGVGYFEHAGTVSGNQHVAIDFTSSQLNDVLQSLTVLDEGGGHIAGVNYNSTTPLAEQLKSLSLGMGDNPTSTELFQALRGQRVEVTGGAGGPITGRLMSIESRTEKAGSGDATVDKFYLTLVAPSGAIRVIELTPALSVRPLDVALQAQLDRYLELLSTARVTGLRHLTLDALGQGQRELRVSYISEVPVWKSTYRLVFPRATASGESSNAVLQGWAVVDNTVGADWDNVQLSLVAGAPQSFIQPLSQPLYTKRPEIPIATNEQTAPQTHESSQPDALRSEQTVTVQSEMQNNALAGPKLKAGAPQAAHGFGVAGMAGLGAANSGVMGAVFGSGSGSGVGGGMYRPSDALQPGDVSTNAFDDYFEYSLTQPVTIHKNESAMVPILQQDLPAEHVTLWSSKEARPLRAVWLENKSKLTLDSGSFSIFESGEFAGEGLLDPIHPGEKRLLSYAVDQAVKVHRGGFANTQTLHHIAMHDGVLVETTSEITESTYTVNNTADEARTVIIEHARRPNAELNSETKPAETTPTAYRFRVAVEPHQSVDLHVGENANLSETVRIVPGQDRSAFLIAVSKYTPDLEQKLKPLIDAETALDDLNRRIGEIEDKERSLVGDESRERDNVTALKGNDAAKRFVEELNRTEDEIAATRKERESLLQQRSAATLKMNALIAQLSFDTNLSVVIKSDQCGNSGAQCSLDNE
jgi:hypothetical protein